MSTFNISSYFIRYGTLACLLLSPILATASNDYTIPANEANSFIEQIRSSNKPLYQITAGNEADPIIFMHGVGFGSAPNEWTEPVQLILQNQPRRDTYFFQWASNISLVDSSKILIESIQKLMETNQYKHITIVGYSAGGVIALLALDQINENDSLKNRVFVHTIASPLFGYQAPNGFSYLTAPFLGLGKVQLGIGADRFLKNKRLNNCQHWINTNCDKDKHSCLYAGMNPQTGPAEQPNVLLPCQSDKNIYFENENHESILLRVLPAIQ